jgi:hypothetical protein
VQLAGSRIVASLCLLFAATVAVPVLSAGCGTAAESLCNTQCDCTGCSVSACSKVYDEDVSQASSVDCGGQANDYINCVQTKAECNGTSYEVGRSCDVEFQRLTTCLISAKCSGTIGVDLFLHVTCPG